MQNKCSKKSCKIHEKTPELESLSQLFDKAANLMLVTSLRTLHH